MSYRRIAGLVRAAVVAGGIAFLVSPFKTQPGQIAQLDGPGNDVSRYYELVVENCSLNHFFLALELT
jgi:hypothetical protein